MMKIVTKDIALKLNCKNHLYDLPSLPEKWNMKNMIKICVNYLRKKDMSCTSELKNKH